MLTPNGKQIALTERVFPDCVYRFYGEYHDWQPTGWAQKDKDQIRTDVKTAGFSLVTWVGERRTYSDITTMNPVNVRINVCS